MDAKRKAGRPKSKQPTKTKGIAFKVTDDEFKKIQDIALKHNLTYAEIFLKGLEYWETI